MSGIDGHVRVLPTVVANKIAAGEVVERPASVVKELVENALDAGATAIRLTVAAGGRKLISVQDNGCGMTRQDALTSLERQATSKIRDVEDIEDLATLGFRGEAIPSIASVSRFSITTRRADSDEGSYLFVEAGQLVEERAAGCPSGTLVEVRDLFCNVPVRRKFLRSVATEEGHVRAVFTQHALAHPGVAFTLVADGREVCSLAAAASASDRVRELFGDEFLDELLPLAGEADGVSVRGFVERPNRDLPTRREQFIFVNGRPATAPVLAYALREAYPRRAGDARPALILFLDVPPKDVDVNVHPTKREVRFRDGFAVRRAILDAFARLLGRRAEPDEPLAEMRPAESSAEPVSAAATDSRPEDFAARPQDGATPTPASAPSAESPARRDPPPEDPRPAPRVFVTRPDAPTGRALPDARPAPVPIEFALDPASSESRPWNWFKFLAVTVSGYLLIETDAGLVTVNPHAARERIAYERLLARDREQPTASQQLLIPETVQLNPVEFARLKAALDVVCAMGFQLEEFGRDVFKVEAVPELAAQLPASVLLPTIARDLAESATRRGAGRWREELVARSVARSFAGAALALTPELATKLVEDLAACRMPYVCPRGKPVMIFTSTRELKRKFACE